MVTSVWSPPSSSKSLSLSSSISSGSSSSSGSGSGAIPVERSSRDRERLPRLGDVVDAEHARAALQRDHVGGDAPGDPVLWVGGAGELVDERLARDADQHAEAERDDLVGPRQQLEVVRHRLAEADARIDVDLLLPHALADGELGAVAEERL